MRILIIFFITVAFFSCTMVDYETEDIILGSCTMTISEGDPDFLMMGQSNANEKLAEEIISATGKSIHQINHGGQSIDRWVEMPYQWLRTDMAFLDGRVPKGFIWMQGEANIGNVDDYEYYFSQIYNSFPHEDNIPVIILETVIIGLDCSSIVNTQKEMCEGNENWFFVETSDCERGDDNTHLTELGRGQLAEKINRLICDIGM